MDTSATVRLFGTFLHTLDDRGRVALPAKLRERLGDKVTITNGVAPNSLVIYPEWKWEEIGRELLSSSGLNETELNMRMYYYGDAWEGDIDNQGRISIPEYLRQAANLTSEVALVGAGDRIVVWDRQEWIAKRAALRANPPTWSSSAAGERAAR